MRKIVGSLAASAAFLFVLTIPASAPLNAAKGYGTAFTLSCDANAQANAWIDLRRADQTLITSTLVDCTPGSRDRVRVFTSEKPAILETNWTTSDAADPSVIFNYTGQISEPGGEFCASAGFACSKLVIR